MKKNLIVLISIVLINVCKGQNPPEGMALVPEGTVSVKDKITDKPQEIQVKSFYMDKYEVTVADFEKFVKATGYKSDADKRGFSYCFGDTVPNVTWNCNTAGAPRPKNEYNRPVTHVSYNDAMAYAKWAKKRLPTEAEWTLTASHYPKRMRLKGIGKIAWYRDNAYVVHKDVQPTGTLQPNDLGIYDLFGNAEEITGTVVGNKSKHAVAKGGSIMEFDDQFDLDGYMLPTLDFTWSRWGFRCAKDL
ncbi:MAG: formylglycine-generating enzyme family protein [Prevotellaceae bacterium]|jgi:formylglycine-generating enzyme required for sulfatase activity|nr:formylglycine-generating enzyme family protein [Prevotellaceae bacterium]